MRKLRLKDRTYSLWGYLANHLTEYLNPLYKPSGVDFLEPDLAPQTIKLIYLKKMRLHAKHLILLFRRFWTGMYNRFENGVHPREPLGDILVAASDHITSLKDHVRLLEKVGIIKNKVYNM